MHVIYSGKKLLKEELVAFIKCSCTGTETIHERWDLGVKAVGAECEMIVKVECDTLRCLGHMEKRHREARQECEIDHQSDG